MIKRMSGNWVRIGDNDVEAGRWLEDNMDGKFVPYERYSWWYSIGTHSHGHPIVVLFHDAKDMTFFY